MQGEREIFCIVHTLQCSRLTPVSALRCHFCWCTRDCLRCQRAYLCWPYAKHTPLLLPLSQKRKFFILVTLQEGPDYSRGLIWRNIFEHLGWSHFVSCNYLFIDWLWGHPKMYSGFFWLCAQWHLVILKQGMAVAGIKPGLAALEIKHLKPCTIYL